eukprot:Colp12_sorted_trinity150504_noHs@11378
MGSRSPVFVPKEKTGSPPPRLDLDSVDHDIDDSYIKATSIMAQDAKKSSGRGASSPTSPVLVRHSFSSHNRFSEHAVPLAPDTITASQQKEQLHSKTTSNPLPEDTGANRRRQKTRANLDCESTTTKLPQKEADTCNIEASHKTTAEQPTDPQATRQAKLRKKKLGNASSQPDETTINEVAQWTQSPNMAEDRTVPQENDNTQKEPVQRRTRFNDIVTEVHLVESPPRVERPSVEKPTIPRLFNSSEPNSWKYQPQKVSPRAVQYKRRSSSAELHAHQASRKVETNEGSPFKSPSLDSYTNPQARKWVSSSSEIRLTSPSLPKMDTEILYTSKNDKSGDAGSANSSQSSLADVIESMESVLSPRTSARATSSRAFLAPQQLVLPTKAPSIEFNEAVAAHTGNEKPRRVYAIGSVSKDFVKRGQVIAAQLARGGSLHEPSVARMLETLSHKVGDHRY